ncbi:hypothetical protein [Microbulbifer sp.]|uniref:hypothetical protein n=1 Tax=Microbulbifer sp. TaxID=1908541 RepID=UPI0025827419|nr:hypothetical protein [Microbulbifer sp.]
MARYLLCIGQTTEMTKNKNKWSTKALRTTHNKRAKHNNKNGRSTIKAKVTNPEQSDRTIKTIRSGTTIKIIKELEQPDNKNKQ